MCCRSPTSDHRKQTWGQKGDQGKTHHRLLLLGGDRDGRAARGTRRQVRHGAAGAARERLLHGVCVVGWGVLCVESSVSLSFSVRACNNTRVCCGVGVTLCVWGNGRRVRVVCLSKRAEALLIVDWERGRGRGWVLCEEAGVVDVGGRRGEELSLFEAD